MNKRFTIIFTLFLLIITSCKSTKAVKPVYITNEKSISLLDLSSSGAPIDCFQLMTASFEGHGEFTAEVFLKSDSDILALVAMTPTGQTLADISYDGNMVNFQSSFIPTGSFRAEYILADIQFAYYNIEDIEKELIANGLVFKYGEDENGTYREILDNNEIIWKATYNKSHLSVKNYLRKYKYEMEML